MSAKKSRLDQLQVTTPCTANWEEMPGSKMYGQNGQNRQKRFCAQCDKTVFDFAEMTRLQVEAVVTAHRGKLCARLTRLPDGTLLMRQTPAPPIVPPIQITTRRGSPILNATIAALLGISVPASAERAILASPLVVLSADQEAGKKRAPKPLGTGDASFGGTALTSQGTGVKSATVKLLSLDGQERVVKTSAEGEFLFAQIPAGAYLLLVEAPGFITHLSDTLTIDAASNQRIDVSLRRNERVLIAGGIGARQPQTLLDLYHASDVIAVADVGPSDVIQTDGEAKLLKTALRIAMPIKGLPSTQTIVVNHATYADISPQFKTGERRLFFLNRRESENGKKLDGFELSGWDQAAKQLDGAAMEVYLQRISELSTLLQKPNHEPAEIAEWLVRCAEDPVTRWDGVHPLLESALRAAWLAESKNSEKAEPETVSAEEEDKTAPAAEPESSEETAEAESTTEAQTPEDAAREAKEAAEHEAREREASRLFEVLTPEQKNRLANLLFNVPQLTEADVELAELVQHFGDARLVPYLTTQLQQIANNAPNLAEGLVSMLAETIGDDDLKQFARDYQDSAQYEESEPNSGRLNSILYRHKRAASPTLAAAKRSMELKKFLALVEVKLKP